MTSAYNPPALTRLAPALARVGANGHVQIEDARMLVLLRCLLGLSALAIVTVEPSRFGPLAGFAYLALTFYSVYAALVTLVSYRFDWPTPHRAMHWMDVFFYASLVALSGGAGHFFFLLFFYPILVASFSCGFREGMAVTAASLGLFVAARLLGVAEGDPFEPGRTLIPAAYLLVFGYMTSYFGGYERLLRRRLALLKEINNVWSPRFGVDHAYGANLDRLLEFYDAKSCVMVLRRPSPALNYVMYTASRDKPGYSGTPSSVAASAAGALLRLPDPLAAFYHDPAVSWRRRFQGYSAYDLELRARTKSFLSECAIWANLLDAQAFVTVPYGQRDGTSGRVFLTSDSGCFTHADIDFLVQVSDAIATVVENMCLVEELISKAAEHERLAISRDLHDTTIQPYIGLKLALDALFREAGEGDALAPRIADLINMTEMTIRDLRDYASKLKDKTALPGEFLVDAVKKQSERLGRFYGIDVEVKSDVSPKLRGRLAAEAFQIISEGLSNVLRHTSAKKAFVSILCENSHLLLQVGNETGNGADAGKEFMPRSIQERAQALGGKTYVEQRSGDPTIVHVTIPM